jgi:hypothetical protein
LPQQLDIAGIDFKYFLGTLAQQRDSLTACWREMTQADLFAWLREQQTQHE